MKANDYVKIIGLGWVGLDWIRLDWIGLDWNGLEWVGLYSIVFDWKVIR